MMTSCLQNFKELQYLLDFMKLCGNIGWVWLKINMYLAECLRINISFYPSSDIQATIERRKNRILENQEEKYGFVINEVESSFIEKDNVIFIGQVTADPFSNNVQVWGYNLLLRKSGPEDLYGEWWVVWFDDSAFARRYPHEYHYPLGVPEFYQEYEFGRGHVMHTRTMGINTLSNEGLDKIMEKLFE